MSSMKIGCYFFSLEDAAGIDDVIASVARLWLRMELMAGSSVAESATASPSLTDPGLQPSSQLRRLHLRICSTSHENNKKQR